jgi:serine/threonine-protein kinase RsbW
MTESVGRAKTRVIAQFQRIRSRIASRGTLGHINESPTPALVVRELAPDEAAAFTALVRRCYGDSYDQAWVYDADEVARRLREGTMHSTVAVVSGDGGDAVVAHLALLRDDADDEVAESGQAVVDPDYRGHHVFTDLKRAAAAWASDTGIFGLYSEATAAHPYSQRANVALGAVETGVLVGYIPASVEYAAIDARPHRQSVVLYYLKTNDGHDRPVYAPPRDRDIVEAIIVNAGLSGVVRGAPADASLPAAGDVHHERREDHNHLIVTALTVGADLLAAVHAARDFAHEEGIDCVYVDLPLADPGTALVGDGVADLGFAFGGIFPNRHHDCDVVRYQYLAGVERDVHDIALASRHGKDLLAYVLGLDPA